jgi:hypothetical protein
MLAGSLLGAFDRREAPPLTLGAAAVLPVVAFIVLLPRWTALREVTMGADLRLLTLAQTWRVGAVTFLILHARGLLPGAFALPAGWGDIAVGATAPLVAPGLSPRRSIGRRLFMTWNVLGLLDLVMAVTLGVLSSPGPLGVLAGEVTTQLMGRFPLSLVPTFFVPLLAILHLASLARARHDTRLTPRGTA